MSNKLTRWGATSQLDEMRQRIRRSVPAAAEAPDSVIDATAQLAVAYGLSPWHGEIYPMKTGGKTQTAGGGWVENWSVYVGVKGLRKKAREIANYMMATEQMEEDEVKKYRGADYDPGDVGVTCTLSRLDVAMQARLAGLTYVPTVARGFWRIKAQLSDVWKDGKRTGQKEWKPDPIPNTWTRLSVAEKRAEATAIKIAFDMRFDVGDPAESFDVDAAYTEIAREIAIAERDEMAPAAHLIEREPDGNILFAPVPTPAPTADRETIVIEPEHVFSSIESALEYATVHGAFSDKAAANRAYGALKLEIKPTSAGQMFAAWKRHVDEIVETQLAAIMIDGAEEIPFDDDGPDYGAIADALTGDVATLAQWAFNLHSNGNGPATPAQYGFLAGLIDKATGHRHGYVLSVLCRREVTAENPCSKNLAAKLLEVIAPTVKDKATGETVGNPNFRQDIVDHLVAIAPRPAQIADQTLSPTSH